LIAGVAAVGLAGGFAAGRSVFRPVPIVVQPIAFNHQTHAGELEIPCDLCHEFYATGEHSGLPTLSTCLDCHEDPLTESSEEQRIRDLAQEGRLDVFRKLFRLPDHSFYSHRRHAELGGISCETCHGDIATTTAPPERPLVQVTMDFCIDCHERERIRAECTSCHR
jgi:hypothetical protein